MCVQIFLCIFFHLKIIFFPYLCKNHFTMKIKKLNTGFFLTSIAMLGLTTSLIAQPEQHGWRGPNRNGIYHEIGLMESWSAEGPQLLWKTEDAGRGVSSPVVAAERVFVAGMNEADKEIFSAYTLDGKRLYQVEYGASWTGTFPETRTTPTIVGNRAYVISGIGEIVCLSTTDGKIVWKVDGSEKFEGKTGTWGYVESPLVFDNKVIFSVGGDKTGIVALNATTGETVWESESLATFSNYASPLLITHNGKKQIIAMLWGYILGINPENGKIEWKFEDWSLHITVETNGKVLCNTPVYSDGKIVVANGYKQGAFLLELNNDATAVKLIWRNEDFDVHHGGFVLVNGTLYGSNWLTNSTGHWVAIDWNTGETRYITPWANNAKGSIISAGEMLYVYEERRGTVALVPATPEKFDVVSEFQVNHGTGSHWAHPVINNGILYIRRGDALMAYKIR
jgi:outer membrane protein assembly factor BamB